MTDKSIEPEQNKIKYRFRKAANFVLGAVVVIACSPLIVALTLVSLIVPQKKWEKFWDLFA